MAEDMPASQHLPFTSPWSRQHTPNMNLHRQGGHATSIHKTDTVIAGKNEKKSDAEPVKPEDGRRCSERPATENASFTSPINPMDWNDPEDPNNPHNWPPWKLAYHTMIPALFGFTV